MSNQQVELALIKAVLSAENPIPQVPFDFAVNEWGTWTIIVYRDDLMNYPAHRTVTYMRWLRGCVEKLHEVYNISVQVRRL